MAGSENDERSLVTYLLGAGVLLLLLGAGAYVSFGTAGLSVLDMMVSAVLTAALVLLYFRQTRILDSQRALLRQEQLREARQQHTETLRDRVQWWHGNPDREIPDDPLEMTGLNLPAVADASFQSAPHGENGGNDEESFQVVPHHLEGDRYLQDLLENHAPDLQEQKDRIETLNTEFVSCRAAFIDSFDGGIVRDMGEYRLEPADYLGEWLFEYLVKQERGVIADFAAVKEQAVSQLARGSAQQRSDEPQIWVRAAIGGYTNRAVYSAVFESAEEMEPREHEPEAKAEVQELVKEIIDEFAVEYPIDQIEEAARILDEAEAGVRELEHLLIEYDGRPVFPGDCEYLEEARTVDMETETGSERLDGNV